jgi:Holliday junction resolvase RusA-like endonuclease
VNWYLDEIPVLARASFTVPGMPVQWQRVDRSRFGVAYVDDETRAAKNTLALFARTEGGIKTPRDEACRVKMLFAANNPAKSNKRAWDAIARGLTFPDLERPDCDNLIKLPLDALNGIAWTDDKRAFDVHGVKVWSASPFTRVEIEWLDLSR